MEVTSQQAWHSVKSILNQDKELFLYLALYLFLTLIPFPLVFVSLGEALESEIFILGLVDLIVGIMYISFIYVCFKCSIAFTTLERLQGRNASPGTTFSFISKHTIFILKLTMLLTLYQIIKLALKALFRDKNRGESIALSIILGVIDVLGSTFMSLLIPMAILEKDYSLRSLKVKTKKIAELFDGKFGWGPLMFIYLAYFVFMVIVVTIVFETYRNPFYTGFAFLSMIYVLLIINQLMDLCMSIYMTHIAFRAYNNPQDKYHLRR